MKRKLGQKILFALIMVCGLTFFAGCSSSGSDGGGGALPQPDPGTVSALEGAKEVLASIGIASVEPEGGLIEEADSNAGGLVMLAWGAVSGEGADSFLTDMAGALGNSGTSSRDDADAKITKWEYSAADGDNYTVTVTYVKQDSTLDNVSLQAGTLALLVEPQIFRMAAYVAVNTSYNNGLKFGIIKGNADVDNLSLDVRVDTMPPVAPGVDASQAKIYAYRKGASATLALERYNYPAPGVEGGSVFSVFDAYNKDINESVIADNLTNWGDSSTPDYAVNAYNMVRVGDYLYIVGYDLPRISKVNLATGSLVSSVEMEAVPGYAAHGQDIIVTQGRVFALFTIDDGSWTNYQNSVVVEVKHTEDDAAPALGDRVNVGKNAVSLVAADNYIYVPAIGGMQNKLASNGAESRIDRITLSANSLSVEADPVYYVDDDYDFHGLVIGKEESLILRIMNCDLDSSCGYALTRPYLTKLKTINLHGASNQAVSTLTDHLIEDGMGNSYIYVMAHDDSFDQFWFGEAGQLTVYNKDLSRSKVFSMRDELYGVRASAVNGLALFGNKQSGVAFFRAHSSRVLKSDIPSLLKYYEPLENR